MKTPTKDSPVTHFARRPSAARCDGVTGTRSRAMSASGPAGNTSSYRRLVMTARNASTRTMGIRNRPSA